eukprot:TRINITY_DN5870_c2_g1_i1.p1 TRINITY_DN5870_c2_g1~~TRINITY_DN5870_c2_g1_i1.p1  ORF type:complete len:331 (+),score=106.12 TRINITY_DN5870_c2_g1_i1:62-994(+)
MGDTLAKPVTDKHSSAQDSDVLRVAVTGMQGWRRSMEDAHAMVLGLEAGEMSAFFGVYDGHCGEATARFVSNRLHHCVKEDPAFRTGDWKTALERAFLRADREVAEDQELRVDGSGCTSVCCLVTRDLQLVCGNAGDSRCVLCRDGRPFPLSFDHKPSCEEEQSRIVNAGAFVSAGRVNGNLALSRALGDLEFKQRADLPPQEQAVTAFPDVRQTEIRPGDEFVVLACDGIWDVLSNEEVVDFVRPRLRTAGQSADIALICEDLCQRCLAPKAPGLGCDNMTVMIVQFTDELHTRAARLRQAAAPPPTTS